MSKKTIKVNSYIKQIEGKSIKAKGHIRNIDIKDVAKKTIKVNSYIKQIEGKAVKVKGHIRHIDFKDVAKKTGKTMMVAVNLISPVKARVKKDI